MQHEHRLGPQRQESHRSRAARQTRLLRELPSPVRRLQGGASSPAYNRLVADVGQHCKAKRHRKFALNPLNWTSLDDCLRRIERPLRPDLLEVVQDDQKLFTDLRRELRLPEAAPVVQDVVMSSESDEASDEENHDDCCGVDDDDEDDDEMAEAEAEGVSPLPKRADLR